MTCAYTVYTVGSVGWRESFSPLLRTAIIAGKIGGKDPGRIFRLETCFHSSRQTFFARLSKESTASKMIHLRIKKCIRTGEGVIILFHLASLYRLVFSPYTLHPKKELERETGSGFRLTLRRFNCTYKRPPPFFFIIFFVFHPLLFHDIQPPGILTAAAAGGGQKNSCLLLCSCVLNRRSRGQKGVSDRCPQGCGNLAGGEENDSECGSR